MQAFVLTVLSAFVLDAAYADPFPKRRPGIWQIQSAASQGAGLPAASQCVGPMTDTAQMHLDRLPGKRGTCTVSAFRPRGQAWIAESVCRRGRHIVTSRKIATGDFETHYRIDTVMRHRVGKQKKPQIKDALVATYLGPCPAGQRPGDLTTPGMGTLNMTDGSFKSN